MVAFFHFSCWGDRRGNFYSESDWIAQIGGHGNMGVYIFFVISGFVITYTLLIHSYKIRDIGRFLLKRSIRIEIPYLASIILVILARYILHLYYHTEFVIRIKQLLLHFLYLIPFTNETWLSSVYWTLGIEFQFYLGIAIIFPLLQWGKEWGKTVVLCMLACTNFYNLISPDVWFIYSHSALFVMGIASAMYFHNRLGSVQLIIILIFCVIISGYVKGWEITLVGFITVIVIQLVRYKDVPGKWLGKISYSLYLTHFLIGNNVIFVYIRESNWSISRDLVLFASMLLSVGFAWIFWLVLERPSQLLASRIKLRKGS